MVNELVFVGQHFFGTNAQAMLVQHGRIAKLGTEQEILSLANKNASRIELGENYLLPGFNDAHVHVWKVGHLRTTMLDLRGLTSLEELYARVRGRAATLQPGQWLLGRGWNESLLNNSPSKEMLDAAAPQNPIVLTRTCAHIHALNSQALQLSGIHPDTIAPAGGEIDVPRGLLFETAYGLVLRAMPEFSVEDYKTFVRAGLKHLASFGITACTDPAVDPALLEAYKQLDAANELPIRVNLLYIRRPDGGSQTYALPEKISTQFLRLDSVKFFADGGLSGATAAISQPYKNTDGPPLGVLRFEEEELYALALEAQTAGFRIGTHAIGDRALDQVLSVYKKLHAQNPNMRHRIEHFGLANPTHLQLAKQLRTIVVPQPIFLHELRHNFLRAIPEAFVNQCYNLRAMTDAGLDVAYSSDGPVVRELNPLVGIQAAMTEAMQPENNATLHQAIHAYTHAGAIAQGDETNFGSLQEGMLADLVVTSDLEKDFATWKTHTSFVAGKEQEKS